MGLRLRRSVSDVILYTTSRLEAMNPEEFNAAVLLSARLSPDFMKLIG